MNLDEAVKKLGEVTATKIVELSTASVIGDPDWNPLEHPRDAEGKFIDKGHGVYLFGKTKKGVIKALHHKNTFKYDLDPGTALYKLATGNHIAIPADGASGYVLFYPTGTKAGMAISPNPTKIPIATSAIAKAFVENAHADKYTLVDYAPAMPLQADSPEEAQFVLDQKAAAYANLLDNGDNSAGSGALLSVGSVAYGSTKGAPGYIIKNNGKIYHYLTDQTQPGDAVEIQPKDFLKYEEEFTTVLNAHDDPEVAAQIKKDLAEKPLEDWEKEILAPEGVKPTPAAEAPAHTVMFHGTLFPATSKFYEHNKTAASYLVVEPNGTPWKIDKTGKMISGAQAVQYLHNYSDITGSTLEAAKAAEPEPYWAAKTNEDGVAAYIKGQMPNAVVLPSPVVPGQYAVLNGNSFFIFDAEGKNTYATWDEAKSVWDAASAKSIAAEDAAKAAAPEPEVTAKTLYGGTKDEQTYTVPSYAAVLGLIDSLPEGSVIVSPKASEYEGFLAPMVAVENPDGTHSMYVPEHGTFVLADSGVWTEEATTNAFDTWKGAPKWEAAVKKEDGVWLVNAAPLGTPAKPLAPISDSVKGKTLEEVAAIPGAMEAGKVYQSPGGINGGAKYYIPNTENYVAVMFGGQTTFSKINTPENQPNYGLNLQHFKGYTEITPAAAEPIPTPPPLEEVLDEISPDIVKKVFDSAPAQSEIFFGNDEGLYVFVANTPTGGYAMFKASDGASILAGMTAKKAVVDSGILVKPLTPNGADGEWSVNFTNLLNDGVEYIDLGPTKGWLTHAPGINGPGWYSEVTPAGMLVYKEDSEQQKLAEQWDVIKSEALYTPDSYPKYYIKGSDKEKADAYTSAKQALLDALPTGTEVFDFTDAGAMYKKPDGTYTLIDADGHAALSMSQEGLANLWKATVANPPEEGTNFYVVSTGAGASEQVLTPDDAAKKDAVVSAFPPGTKVATKIGGGFAVEFPDGTHQVYQGNGDKQAIPEGTDYSTIFAGVFEGMWQAAATDDTIYTQTIPEPKKDWTSSFGPEIPKPPGYEFPVPVKAEWHNYINGIIDQFPAPPVSELSDNFKATHPPVAEYLFLNHTSLGSMVVLRRHEGGALYTWARNGKVMAAPKEAWEALAVLATTTDTKWAVAHGKPASNGAGPKVPKNTWGEAQGLPAKTIKVKATLKAAVPAFGEPKQSSLGTPIKPVPSDDEVAAATSWAEVAALFDGEGTIYVPVGDPTDSNSYFVPAHEQVYVHRTPKGEFGISGLTGNFNSIEFLKTSGGFTSIPASTAIGVEAAVVPTKLVYTHPSGVKMHVPDGAKIYQHNKVKESFLVVSADGSAVKYDKTGKSLNGAQQVAVLHKNYTNVTDTAGVATPDPLAAAAKKVPAKKAITKKAAATAKKYVKGDTLSSGMVYTGDLGFVESGSSVWSSTTSEDKYLVHKPDDSWVQYTKKKMGTPGWNSEVVHPGTTQGSWLSMMEAGTHDSWKKEWPEPAPDPDVTPAPLGIVAKMANASVVAKMHELNDVESWNEVKAQIPPGVEVFKGPDGQIWAYILDEASTAKNASVLQFQWPANSGKSKISVGNTTVDTLAFLKDPDKGGKTYTDITDEVGSNYKQNGPVSYPFGPVPPGAKVWHTTNPNGDVYLVKGPTAYTMHVPQGDGTWQPTAWPNHFYEMKDGTPKGTLTDSWTPVSTTEAAVSVPVKPDSGDGSDFVSPTIDPKPASTTVKVTGKGGDSYTTVTHKYSDGEPYTITKGADGKWSVTSSTGEVLANDFKQLKQAKEWIAGDQPGEQAVATQKIEMHGVTFSLSPGTTVYHNAHMDGFTALSPYANFGVNKEGGIFGAADSKTALDKAVKNGTLTVVASVAVPPYKMDLAPYADYDLAGSDAYTKVQTFLGEFPSYNGVDLVAAEPEYKRYIVGLQKAHKLATTASAKSKITKTIKSVTLMAQAAEAQRLMNTDQAVPVGLAAAILDFSTGDMWKGAHKTWSMGYNTSSSVINVQAALKRREGKRRLKDDLGIDVTEEWLKDVPDSLPPGVTVEEVQKIVAQQGFAYADGLVPLGAAKWLRTYALSGWATTVYTLGVVKPAQQVMLHSKSKVEYAELKAAQQAKPKKPADATAAAAAVFKANAVEAAKGRLEARTKLTAQYPAVLSTHGTLSATNYGIDWWNENGPSDTPPVDIKATSVLDWNTAKMALAGAMYGSPLVQSAAEDVGSNSYEETYADNKALWDGFNAVASQNGWLAIETLPTDLTATQASDICEAVGLGKQQDNDLAMHVATRLLDVAKATHTLSGVKVAAAQPTKITDPTQMPDDKPDWADETAWAIVGLSLAGKMPDAVSGASYDLGSAWAKTSGTSNYPGHSEHIPPTKFLEFPSELFPLIQWTGNTTNSGSGAVGSSSAQIIAYLADLGYWEPPQTAKKTLKHPSKNWTFEAHLAPGDKVYEYSYNSLLVKHQSGTGYQITPDSYYSTSNVKVAAIDKDYLDSAEDNTLVYEEPVVIDAEYAEAKVGVTAEQFNEFTKASQTAAADLSLPGMAGTSKGESLVFMKKHLSLSEEYGALATKIPLMSDGTLKYLHYSAKAGLTAPFDLAMLFDSHGQFDESDEDEDYVTYKIPASATWASQASSHGITPYAIEYHWPSSNSVKAYTDVFGYAPNESYGLTSSEAEDLAAVLSGEVKWTDPNKVAKATKKSTKGTLDFTQIPDKNLGGMHSKKYWADQYGNEWMSKAFPSDPFTKARVDAEHYACEISRLFGYGAPETRIQGLGADKEYSYIQFLAPSSGSLAYKSWSDISPDLLQQAMSEHVLDWVISNHDTHQNNLLLSDDGTFIFGIDKGQAWRFFPDDQLSEGYKASNPEPVWYDIAYKAIRTKQMPKEQADALTDAVLRKAAYVSARHDEAYREMLEKAFANRTKFSTKHKTKKAFIDALMARKASTFDDFSALYKGLYQSAGYDWPEKTIDDYLPKKIGTAHVAITPDLAEDVLVSGTHGQAVFFSGAEFEDAHMMMFTTKNQTGGLTLRGEAQLLSSADKIFTTWLQQHSIEKGSMTSAPVVHKPDHEVMPGLDTAFNAAVQFVKTVNSHAEDKSYNQSTVDTAAAQQTGLENAIKAVEAQIAKNPLVLGSAFGSTFVTAEQQQAWLTGAQTILGYFVAIKKAHHDQVKYTGPPKPLTMPGYKASAGVDTSGKPTVQAAYEWEGKTYSKYSDGNYVMTDDSATTASTPGDFTEAATNGTAIDVNTVEPVEAEAAAGESENVVSVANKIIKIKHQHASTYVGNFDPKTGEVTETSKYSTEGMTGMEYEISYDNIKMRYMTYAGNSVSPTQQGLLRLEVEDWHGETSSMETMFAVLRDAGLDLAEADETDLEITYWRRLAAVLRSRKEAATTKGKATLAAIDAVEGMSTKTAERDALREAWKNYYGGAVDDAVSGQYYLPKFATPRTGELQDYGRPVWNRPHTETYAQLKDWTNGHMIRHSVSYGSSYAGAATRMKQVLESGALIATEERTRVLGQWVPGASSSSDQGYGSASFTFTRQKMTPQSWDFIIEPQVYYRDTNYAFGGDNFGDMSKKGSSPFDIQKMISSGGSSGNELMLKNGIYVMDDMAVAIVSDASTLSAVLKFYKDLGITEIRGIPVEERFVSSEAKAKQTIDKIWDKLIQKDKEGVA